jgi:drug/metabolite transporter (DMT)-like permease
MKEGPTRNLRNDFAGWSIVAFAAMLWASDLSLRPKVLATGLDSVTIVFFEHAALALLFLPIVMGARQELKGIRGREFLALLFISWAGSSLATVLITQAYAAGDPFTAALLQKLQPAFALALAGPILHERRKREFWLWFPIAFFGAYLISFGFTWIGDPLNRKNLAVAVYAVTAAALWGASTVVGRWSLGRVSPLPVAGMRFTLALPILFVWAVLGNHLHGINLAQLTNAVWPLALIVLLPDALAMCLYYVGLERTPASLATLAELAYPATAILISLGTSKKFLIGQCIGIGILLASLFFIRRDHLVLAPAKTSET